MSVTAYKILESDSASDLAAQVTASIADGYQPFGPPELHVLNGGGTRLIQSMAKGSQVVAGVAMKSLSQTVLFSDFTDTVSGEAQSINLGAALPADAVLVAHELQLDTQFAGGSVSALSLSLGVSGDLTGIINAFAAKTSTAGGKKYAPGYSHTGGHGDRVAGNYGAAQLLVTATPTADSLSHLTAGQAVVTVWYLSAS